MNETIQRLRRKPSLEEAPLHGELMLFDSATSNFFVLNRTMALTWRNADASTPEEIAAELEKQFDGVTTAQARADVNQAIEELIALGLLEQA